MPNDNYALSAKSQQTIAAWRRALPSKNVELLKPLLAEHATFHSPAVQSPIKGRDAAFLVLTAVAEVLDNMSYHRTFVGGPCEVALEFSGDVGKLHLTGVDLMRLDADGLVVEFEVIMRPLRALSALAEAVGSRIGPQLLQMKLKPDPG
ncbi:MAG: nuclear transport factor 2 family protein [Rhodopseudomonas palustris]|uniref:Nuclear transport factor 2 family protein n=1 Tax=Rhodopseudomonas palustris TaxID=1076 RepID=A0A933VZI4_RHOPL|nr:nuclear transport factor 2 family protein [Rhodopseudomonas palustris]